MTNEYYVCYSDEAKDDLTGALISFILSAYLPNSGPHCELYLL